MIDQDWIPVFAAFGGAIIGGAVSAMVQWLSSRHQRETERLRWRDENRRWMSEHELTEYRELFNYVEQLSDAVSQMRIRIAREKHAAHQFVTAEQARTDFEEKIWTTKRSLMLMDDETNAWLKKFNQCYQNWYVAPNQNEAIEALMVFESTIDDFRAYTAKRYKAALSERENV